MPWEVRQSGPDGKRFCVHVVGSDQPPVACHETEAAAQAQVAALYAAMDGGSTAEAHRKMSAEYAARRQDTVGMERRFDAAPLGRARETPQGGLRVPGVVTRTGVFVYRTRTGVRREYHPADVVAESVASLPDAPVTLDHPPEGEVNPENYRRVSRGQVSDSVRFDSASGHVEAEVVVQDRDVINGIVAGKIREMSSGYFVALDATPGLTPTGEPYDVRVTRIVHNHVALGGHGFARAGREASLRLDGAGNQELPSGQRRSGMEIQIGQESYDLSSDADARRLTKAVAQIESLVATRTAERDALQARVDSLTGERESLQSRADGAELAVEIERCKSLAPKVDLGSCKTVRAVREQVLAANEVRVDASASDEYLKVRVDLLREMAPAKTPAPSAAADLRGSGEVRTDHVDRIGEKAQKAWAGQWARARGMKVED